MKRVVSVSLGSPKGDFSAIETLLGETFEISRVGTNGDMKRFAELMRELDGKVDALGLGGTDMYLYAGGRRYIIRDAAKLAANAKTTPVVDGSGLKNTIERQTMDWLQSEGVIDFSQKKVFVVCGVDRFGIAEAAVRLSKSVVFGDLMFSVGIPIPIRSYGGLRLLAQTLLPIVCRLPFTWIYPTGEKQEKNTPKYEKYFRWADVITGDAKYIARFMPTPESGALAGKTVITNTLTPGDVQNMKDRGVKMLVSTTLQLGERPSTGTNVLEGIIVALMGKRPEELTPQDYHDILARMGWRPTVRILN